MKSKVSYKLLNGMVIIGIVLTLCALIGTPLVITAFFKSSEFNPTNPDAVMLVTTAIYCCAVPFMVALFKLKGICRLICHDNAFSPKLSKSFTDIAICAFAEAIVFLIVHLIACTVFNLFMLALTVIPTFIVLFVSITAGILMLVFANIFKKASEIKAENDLTF